ncbi:MAG TPA: outer membrane beta-barrel protein [Candidatus Eisenbacteria bacterium]
MHRRIIALFAVLLAGTAAAQAAASSLTGAESHPARRHRVASAGATGGGIEGQTIFRAHLGFSAPTGTFGDVYDSGPGFGGSIGYGVSRKVLLSFDVAYHHFDNHFLSNRDASITPLTVGADVILPTSGKVKPWIGGGIGMYHVRETTDVDVGGLLQSRSVSEDNAGVNFGMGIGAPISPRTLVGAGVKFHQVWGNDFIDTPFFTFQMGFGFVL